MIFAVSEVYMRVEKLVKDTCLSEYIPEREIEHFITDVIDYIMVNEHLRVGHNGAYIWGATLMQVRTADSIFRICRFRTTPRAGPDALYARVHEKTHAADDGRRILGKHVECSFSGRDHGLIVTFTYHPPLALFCWKIILSEG